MMRAQKVSSGFRFSGENEERCISNSVSGRSTIERSRIRSVRVQLSRYFNDPHVVRYGSIAWSALCKRDSLLFFGMLASDVLLQGFVALSADLKGLLTEETAVVDSHDVRA